MQPELKQVWEKYYSETEQSSHCRISHNNTHFDFKTEHDLKNVFPEHMYMLYMLNFQLDWCIMKSDDFIP